MNGVVRNIGMVGGSISGARLVGGLVGTNGGTISDSYATGVTNGPLYAGGVVGEGPSGTITNTYWNTQTTRRSVGVGIGPASGTTVLTTATLQTAGAATNLGSAFSGGAGLNPYLTRHSPGGVQAISGTAYKDSGTTAAASGSGGTVTVTGFAKGSAFGTATTGADGSYHIAGPAGSFASGDSRLLHTTANTTTGSTDAATLATATGTTPQSGIVVYGKAVTLSTAATALSGAPTLAAAQASAIAATGNDAAATAVINAIAGRGLLATGSGFTIEQTVDSAGRFLVRTATGAPLTVSSPVAIQSGGSLGLLSGGTLAVNAPVTIQGAGAVALAYDATSATNLGFGNGAGLTYTDAAGAAITSGAGGILAINGDAHTLLYSMADIDGIDSTAASANPVNNQADGLSGRYALARSFDAAGTTYSGGLVPGTFSGVFEGLGQTIAGLTIATSGSSGLFSEINAAGVVRNLGLAGGAVTGSTGAVSTTAGVGGLVGLSLGTVANSYATGAVSGTNVVGGLVSANATDIAGSGTISNAYATGRVTGTATVGGLVGSNLTTVTNSYWNTGTTGRSTAFGQDSNGQSATGLTTADFQTAATATSLGAAFGGGAGLHPYLTSLFPAGVQAVSGTVTTASVGADGSYYVALPTGSIDTGGSSLLAWSTGAASNGATFQTGVTADRVTGFDITGNRLAEATGLTTLSALDAAYATSSAGSGISGSLADRAPSPPPATATSLPSSRW